MIDCLTDKNYKIYAINGYNNPYCLTEREFDLDLSKVGTIRKLISMHLCGHTMNIRVIVNTIICFYNVFDHTCAANLLAYKASNHEILVIINTILRYLSLHECCNEVNNDFMNMMISEFGEKK